MPAKVTADGIALLSQNTLTFCHPPQQNLQADVMLILKCLMQGDNMTDLDNEKVINLCNNTLSCIYHSLQTY